MYSNSIWNHIYWLKFLLLQKIRRIRLLSSCRRDVFAFSCGIQTIYLRWYSRVCVCIRHTSSSCTYGPRQIRVEFHEILIQFCKWNSETLCLAAREHMNEVCNIYNVYDIHIMKTLNVTIFLSLLWAIPVCTFVSKLVYADIHHHFTYNDFSNAIVTIAY